MSSSLYSRRPSRVTCTPLMSWRRPRGTLTFSSVPRGKPPFSNTVMASLRMNLLEKRKSGLENVASDTAGNQRTVVACRRSAVIFQRLRVLSVSTIATGGIVVASVLSAAASTNPSSESSAASVNRLHSTRMPWRAIQLGGVTATESRDGSGCGRTLGPASRGGMSGGACTASRRSGG